MRLLLVEDDVATAAQLGDALRGRLHDVHTARDGRDAIFMAGDSPYDAVILDRRLPFVDGMGVLKRLRADGLTVPIVMLTALGDRSDKIDGLDAGADDYLVKPVDIGELDARLRAVTRRLPNLEEPGVLRAGTITVNLLQHKVTRAGTIVPLLGLEFATLAVLVRNAHNVVTRHMLLEEVWGYDFEPATNIVDAQIARIRTKINIGFQCDAIATIRGAGYKIREGA